MGHKRSGVVRLRFQTRGRHSRPKQNTSCASREFEILMSFKLSVKYRTFESVTPDRVLLVTSKTGEMLEGLEEYWQKIVWATMLKIDPQ